MEKGQNTPLSQMIIRLDPQLRLSGDIDNIFDEILKPTIAYNFTVSLTMEQVNGLLDWVNKPDSLSAAIEQFKAGGSAVPAQLMLEFVKAVDVVILKGRQK